MKKIFISTLAVALVLLPTTYVTIAALSKDKLSGTKTENYSNNESSSNSDSFIDPNELIPSPEELQQQEEEQKQLDKEKQQVLDDIKNGKASKWEASTTPQTEEEKAFWEKRAKDSELEYQKTKENNQIVKDVIYREFNKTYQLNSFGQLGLDSEATVVIKHVVQALQITSITPQEKKALQIHLILNGSSLDENDPVYLKAIDLLQSTNINPYDPFDIYSEE